MTMQEFIKSAGLSMTVKPADQNPNMIDADPRMNHYACKIKCGRSQLTIPFSMGAAHTKEPSLDDVLECLASDAAGVENARDFDEWCSEYGYDTDSRKAERTYRVCERQRGQLQRLLGPSAYDTLLYKIER